MVTRDYLPQVACDDPTRPLRMLAFRKDCPGHPIVGRQGGGDGEGEGEREEEGEGGEGEDEGVFFPT